MQHLRWATTIIVMSLEYINIRSHSDGRTWHQCDVYTQLSGTGKFHLKDWNTSQALFEASMLYSPEGDTMMRAKILRLICLCYLGDGKHEQAKWFVDEAEKVKSC